MPRPQNVIYEAKKPFITLIDNLIGELLPQKVGK
jgi:hypothetical protein